jgi:ankyrin repeat protein
MEELLLSYGATPIQPKPSPPKPDGGAEEKPKANWLGITPLHNAAKAGDVAKAKTLLKAGADIHARDDHNRSTPLAWAARFGQLEMAKFLLRHGAARTLPDDPSWATPRAWALRRGHAKIAKLLE